MIMSNKLFLGAVIFMILAVLGTTTYKYLIAKNYQFNVEASCDPTNNKCFQRDCSNPDDCPPNQLSFYRVFTLSASDFGKCLDNSCLKECTSGVIKCEETICGDSEGDECAEVTSTTETEASEEISTSTQSVIK